VLGDVRLRRALRELGAEPGLPGRPPAAGAPGVHERVPPGGGLGDDVADHAVFVVEVGAVRTARYAAGAGSGGDVRGEIGAEGGLVDRRLRAALGCPVEEERGLDEQRLAVAHRP
jgi:hypothetical protein